MLIVSLTLLLLFALLFTIFYSISMNNAKINLHDQATSLSEPYTDMNNYIQIHTNRIQLSGIRDEDDGSIQIQVGQVGIPGSLMNPENAPDDFELNGIKYFYENEDEQYNSELVEINGQEVYRYLEPLKVNESCIGCHAGNLNSHEDWPYFSPELKVGDLKGAVTVTVPAEHILGGVRNDTYTLMSGSIIIIILLLAIIYFTIRKTIVNPVQQTVSHMQSIAKGDISDKPLSINAKNEIGELVTASEQMKARLRQLILHVKNSAEQVAASAQKFTSNCEDTSKTAEQISQTISQMASTINHQSDKTSIITNSTLHSRKYFEKVSEQTNTLKNRSQETNREAHKGKTYVQNTLSQIIVIENTVEQLSKVIQNLSERSNAITSIVHVISDISEQTNLLALNAAIEASRAGEQGRGFAVVADEVRKLAEQSSTSANSITDLVSKIQDDINSVVTKMEYGLEEVKKGKDLADIAEESFDQILQSITTTVKEIEDVTEKTNAIASQTNQIFNQLEAVNALAEKVNLDSVESTSKVEQQNEAISFIKEASKDLTKLSEQLLSSVQKFKL